MRPARLIPCEDPIPRPGSCPRPSPVPRSETGPGPWLTMAPGFPSLWGGSLGLCLLLTKCYPVLAAAARLLVACLIPISRDRFICTQGERRTENHDHH